MKEPHFSFKNIYVISALRQSLVPALCVDGLHPQWGRQEGDRLILGHAGPERPGRSGGGDKATCAAAGIESQTPPQQSHRRRQHPGWSWRGGPLVLCDNDAPCPDLGGQTRRSDLELLLDLRWMFSLFYKTFQWAFSICQSHQDSQFMHFKL